MSFLPVQKVCSPEHVRRICDDKADVSLDVWQSGEQAKIVCFRGSISLRNIVTYVRNKRVQFRFCDKSMYVHQGVMEMFWMIHNDLLEIMTMRQKYVLFCGYSLGGALAMLAAMYFSLMFPGKHIECHTFGAPMVGDDAFIETFDQVVKESVHVVNQNDLVPKLLPFTLPLAITDTFCPVYPHRVLVMKGGWNILKQHDIQMYVENIELDIQKQRLM